MTQSARKPYKRPPITEAVISFHLTDALSGRTRDRIQSRLASEYPRAETVRDVTVAIGPSISVDETVTGTKLSSPDGLSVVNLLKNQVGISRLAPYVNWDALSVSAMNVWKELTKIAGIPTLRHVSTRYINRIDVPTQTMYGIAFAEYFNLEISAPCEDQDHPYSNFYINTICRSRDGRFQYNVKFGNAVPVLIDRTSFLFDIDTTTTGSVPLRHDDLWALFSELRKRKNICFESYLKDATRALFE